MWKRLCLFLYSRFTLIPQAVVTSYRYIPKTKHTTKTWDFHHSFSFPVHSSATLLSASKWAVFCFCHNSLYRPSGFDMSSKWLPLSATRPCSSTKIWSASTTVDSLWAITMVVLPLVILRKALRIFWKRNKKQINHYPHFHICLPELSLSYCIDVLISVNSSNAS